ncbi:hypothetical protein BHF68_07565 [Desulfuribacillus alkaliarsenatis]|uniref:RDD domain-containing protein n=1 Tax=Desulfuribacillus alkaliarsenatis TaxID=766136 RepID=A0A1E5G1D3_9FIRM|nr:hypothetical protein BHF68_07565 [Desulfuribacillus alkaliarsenatis]
MRKVKYRTAGFWVRFLAYIVDLISIGALSAIFLSILFRLIELPTAITQWMTIGFATVGLIGFVYFTVMTRYWSQTLGKMIMGIRVVKRDGEYLDWITVLIREIPGRAISQLLGSHIGYLWVAFHPKKLSWHDMFCDTYVVHVHEIEKQRWVNILPISSDN